MKTCQMYIDGAFIPNGDAQMIDIINPATEEVCAQIPYCTEADVDKAVKAAYAAQDAWSKLPGIERQHYLEELVQLMRDHYDEFVDQLIEEQGKTVPGAQGEVSYAIDYFKYFAEFGRRIDGEIVQSDRPNEVRYPQVDAEIGVVEDLELNTLHTGWFDICSNVCKPEPALEPHRDATRDGLNIR